MRSIPSLGRLSHDFSHNCLSWTGVSFTSAGMAAARMLLTILFPILPRGGGVYPVAQQEVLGLVEKKSAKKASKKESGLLVPVEQYLSSGIHIGTVFRTGFMRKFIFKTRPDRLNVMDIQKIDQRIRMAGKFLANYEPGDIVVVARRKYAQHAAHKFAEVIGAKAIVGRFVPGTFTNPQAREFLEPAVVFVSDPVADKEAIDEAAKVRIPVVAICNTNNTFQNIDLVIPGNNRGKRALALIYCLLAREYLLNRGIIKSYDEFNVPLSEFEGGRR